MFNEYICFPKSKKISVKDKDIISSIIKENEDLKLIKNNELELAMNKKNYKLTYKINGNSNGNEIEFYIVKFITSNNSSEDVKILEQIDEKINTCSKIGDLYYLMQSYDDVSVYYCNQIFYKINEFERILKKFLYNVFVSAYGIKWVDEVLNNKVEKGITRLLNNKDNKDNKDNIIMKGIETMGLGDIESVLFNTHKKDSSYVVNKIEEYFKYNDKSFNKEELEEIKKGLEISLWDKLFAEKVNIDKPKEKFNSIRNYRNIVAHCQKFTNVDFANANKNLDLFIKELSQAIESFDIGFDKNIFNIIPIIGSTMDTIILMQFSDKINKVVQNEKLLEIYTKEGIKIGFIKATESGVYNEEGTRIE